MLRLYLKISDMHVCFILQDEFWDIDLFIWSNFNFLLSSQWINFPTQSRLVLLFYTFKRFFFTPALANGFYWSLSDSKFLQVSRTLNVLLLLFTH